MSETSTESKKKRGCLFWASVIPLAFVLVVVLVMAGYLVKNWRFPFERGSFEYNLAEAAENNRQGVRVADLTPFEWEIMCTYDPYDHPDPEQLPVSEMTWRILFTGKDNTENIEPINFRAAVYSGGRNDCFSNNAVAHFFKGTTEGNRDRTYVRFSEAPTD